MHVSAVLRSPFCFFFLIWGIGVEQQRALLCLSSPHPGYNALTPLLSKTGEEADKPADFFTFRDTLLFGAVKELRGHV